MSYFPGAPFASPFAPPRFHGSNDFAPLFRLFDDFISPSTRALEHAFQAPQSRTQYQPRFDVREVESAYELRGELPGVESKDLEVEFTDPQTLIIRGHTEREFTFQQTQPQTEQTTTKAVDNSDAQSTHSTSSFQKASVEDEFEQVDATPATPLSSTNGEPTQVEQTAETTSTTNAQPEIQTNSQEHSQYWISERSIGNFQRTFTFTSRVDTDNVKASLKNGILSLIVPKAATPEVRRVQIE